jgi:uncharacterized protein YbaA (DUF1428 family)
MGYVDGYVVPVKTNKKDAYIKFARQCVPLFKDYGALSIVETWGEDVPDGTTTSFPLSVKLQKDETVVFSWIIWSSKQARDEAWIKIEQDQRMKDMEGNMPFDGKRIIFGGFDKIIDE